MSYTALFSRDPLHNLDQLARRVDALLDEAPNRRRAQPPVDVREADEGWLISVDVPGIDLESLSVTHEGDEIVLRATTEDARQEGWELVRRERRVLDMERRLRFARPVDADGIQAHYTDGVLRVAVPRARTTRIPITLEATS